VQYLTFTLDGEAFATDITRVREVLEHTNVTRIPRTPEYMQGVINLRGNVVPVMDLRMQFGMAAAEVTVDTCIIIIEVNINGCSTVLGALADSVQEVIDLRPEQMEPAPTLGTRVSNQFIQAMGKARDESFIIVLNMDKVFSAEQIQEAEKTSAETNGVADTEAA
jgi:purine-binding chemotaxis protein CheW